MDIVYQLTFFLTLGMLGIVMAVFVFAVTQIGTATKAAAKEQENKMLEKKDTTSLRINNIEKKLEEAKKGLDLDVANLTSEVEDMNEELRNYDIEIEHIKERVGLITRRGAVVYPGGLFLVALVLSITSNGLAGNASLETLALWVWVLSLVPLVFGIYRVYQTLGVVEEVTVGSEEALDKLPEAVKVALRELEEEKKPELKVDFIGEHPPIRMVVGEETDINVRITLTKGDIARSPVVAFFVPTGFDFLGGVEKNMQPEDEEELAGMLGGFYTFRDCQRVPKLAQVIRIKAPTEVGVYEFLYTVSCEGFEGGRERMQVEVVDVKA